VLRARLATAAVAIPLLLLLVLAAPAWIFAAVVGVIAIVGVLEYMTMAFADQPRDRAVGAVLGAVVTLAALGGAGPLLCAAIAGSLAVGLVSTFAWREEFETAFGSFGTMLIGALYVGFLLPHFTWLREGIGHGPEVVVFLLAVVMAGDTGGYFVGRSFGRHKLSPRVSPGKSVEGSVGIVVFGVVGGVLAKSVILPVLAWLAGASLLLPLSWAETLSLAFLASVVGQLGDLGESVVKRTFRRKESGWIFPGHGGVLDRIDSLLFPVALVYYYLLLAG